MEQVNKEVLEKLLAYRGKGPSISLYMPTARGREKARENLTRFKNLLASADNALEKKGLSSRERADLLEPGRKLLDDSPFWANQSSGLAFFLTEGFSRYFRLPLAFGELAAVRDSFHLKPMFALLAVDGQFYVLALSQKDARMLRGTRATIEELDLGELIERFMAEFGDELPEQHVQYHTRAPVSGAMRSAIYFGHGGEIDSAQRERLLNYFRFIDRELHLVLEDNRYPLILACVDYLFPLYRSASKYPLLVDNCIKGNPENLGAGDLHTMAWEIIAPYFQQRRQETAALYHELKGTGKTSHEITEILPAAYHGRVSDLFVVPGIQQMGWFDPESGTTQLSEENQAAGEDLIDLAAAETFLNSGNVFAVEADLMPDEAPAAAILRW